ncbi:MAG: ankyrin repeat domain-containing protein [Deltaproteobacteria bacterium]|nr:ankyrin repeat domain-containing protein [Deltaproteobacteria bacterium]
MNAPFASDSEGRTLTPLLAACLGNASEIAEVLLAHGAAVNTVDSDGNTPLIVG